MTEEDIIIVPIECAGRIEDGTTYLFKLIIKNSDKEAIEIAYWKPDENSNKKGILSIHNDDLPILGWEGESKPFKDLIIQMCHKNCV